jgi:hypothetical protein
MALRFWLTRERLILGTDRLQLVQGGKVTAQIPYRNILNTGVFDDEGETYLGIALRNPQDPDTFDQGADHGRKNPQDGWHYRLAGYYQRSLEAIEEMLRARQSIGNEGLNHGG